MTTSARVHKKLPNKTQRELARLALRVDELSTDVPQSVLDEIQFKTLVWVGPELVNLGPSQPTETQLENLLIQTCKLTLDLLEQYRKGGARNV